MAVNLRKAAKHVNRPAAPVGSECFLYLGTFAAVVMAISTAIMAITFALQPVIDAPRSHAPETGSEISRDSWPYLDLGCADKSVDNRRTTRLISTSRIEKTRLPTVVASVAPTDNIETRAVPQQLVTDVVPSELSVIRSNQAEVRSPKNAKHARARIWREKSFTGAGRGFDAVH